MVKRKAEERAKKAAERSSRLTKRAAPKATTSVSKKRKVVKDSFPSCLEPGSERKDDEDASSSVPQRKKRKTASKNDDNINPKECCVCFRTFEDDEVEETGLEWVECACKRWLHEDCIDYATNVAVDGKELLCPYCCV